MPRSALSKAGIVNFTVLSLDSCVNLQLVRWTQIVQLNELIESWSGDAQQPGGLGLIPAGFHQGLENIRRLQGRYFGALSRGRGLRGRVIFDLGRQMLQSNGGTVAQDKGVFDGMLQFSHISRPGINHEDFQDVLGNPLNVFVITLIK